MNFLDSITLWRSNSSNYRLSPRFLKPLHYLHLPKTGSLYVCMDNNKTGSTNDHQGSIDIWCQKPQKSVGHRGCLYGSSLKQESQWESSRYRREGPTRRRWKRIERMSDDGSNLEVFPGQWGAWHGGEKARWLCDRQRECQAWRSVRKLWWKEKERKYEGETEREKEWGGAVVITVPCIQMVSRTHTNHNEQHPRASPIPLSNATGTNADVQDK